MEEETTNISGENPWLQMAQEAYSQSTTYADSNYRRKWEDSLRHFQGKHHAGSKYNKEAYKYRSKIFRPKTRSAIRQNEAAAMVAFFSNQDVVSIDPVNPNNEAQRASAEIVKELINYRLTETIPWFLICIGAFQTAQVMGAVCSYQYWEYTTKTKKVVVQVEDPISGEIIEQSIDQEIIVKDRPCIELQPLENIRFAPSADWTDPIKSSPYVIRMIPMYVMDVRARMTQKDNKTGAPKWKALTDAEIMSAMKQNFDPTRLTREQREDKYERATSPVLKPFGIVWVHENFFRVGDEEWVYYTLGTEHLLTDPAPLEEVYLHGERPLTFGIAVIEALKVMPDSLVETTASIQREINQIANSRLDNVQFVLNKRWVVKRGAQVDIKSITRNVPGSVTLANDPAGDIRQMEFADVTSSSYQEQDRLNLDFDELAGTFSAATIQSNRRMNETVGGMQLLKGSVGGLTEYLLRVFSETWLEPTIKQLVKLEQGYETDEVVLALVAEKMQLFQKYGVDAITDSLLNQNLTTSVNVGSGVTDPMARLHNLMVSIELVGKVLTSIPPGTLNNEEIIKEIFSRVGYKDGTRFLLKQGNTESPAPGQTEGAEQDEMQQAVKIMQSMKQEIDNLQSQLKDKSSDRDLKMALATMQHQLTMLKENEETRRKAADIQSRVAIKHMDLQNPVSGERVRSGY